MYQNKGRAERADDSVIRVDTVRTRTTESAPPYGGTQLRGLARFGR
jgi:hypothetical protein